MEEIPIRKPLEAGTPMNIRVSAAILSISAIAVLTACATLPSAGGGPAVTPGIETLLGEEAFLSLVRGQRVGLLTNPTGVDHLFNSTIDLLNDHPEIELVALFGPEHGIRGDAYAGAHVGHEVDSHTGVPIYSLYGGGDVPMSEILEDVDVMLYDIQDVGSRSYTYIYAMSWMMDECGAAGVPVLVLDRPNPSGAHIVDGNILHPEEGTSGVGKYAIAYQYGMTPGEAAQLFNAEFIDNPCDLTVVPMRGYRRNMWQDDTGLPFVPTSTHIPRENVAIYYNLVGIIGELHNISIAVGYTLPFECIAAPYIDPYELTEAFRALDLPGLGFRPISFSPRYASFNGEMCHGVQIFLTDRDALRPVTAQIHFMETLQRMYPEQDLFAEDNPRRQMFDKVMGTSSVRRRILAGDSAEEIIAGYQDEVEAFMALRAQHLIYD
jgi:uncharacterized protein YbbC (DUF1343 family)